jgi:hypothetical protein
MYSTGSIKFDVSMERESNFIRFFLYYKLEALNLPHLHNQYESAQRKNPEYMLKLLVAMYLQLKFELILIRI